MLRSLAFAGAILGLLGVSSASSVAVPQSQIDAENAHWRELGAHLPPGGIVLSHPYAAPYSNRSFVVPYAWYGRFYDALNAKHDVPVNAAALRADLPVLHVLVEKTYAGYDGAAKRGWNWNAMFAAWSRQLAKDGNRTLPLRKAFAPWEKLESVQPDNHSGVAHFAGFASGSASAQLHAAPAGVCTALRMSDGRIVRLAPHDAAEQPHAVQAWSGSRFTPAWYTSYPKREGSAVSVRCAGRDDALTVLREQAVSQTPVYQTLADGIAYVRIPTFTNTNDDALHAAIAKAPALGRERVVIFDLRGNDGGHVPSDLLDNWFAESAVEIASTAATQYGTTSCFNTALDFGLQQQLVDTLKPPLSTDGQQYVQGIVDTLKGPSTCEVAPAVQRSDRRLTDHHFQVHREETDQTRIVALVDGACSNECESLIYTISGLPDSVIVGASTNGVLGFTQPGYFVLPNSRVPFQLAQARNDIYGDGRSVDGYGITVDVLLPTAKSQSTASLLALAQLLSS